MADEQYRWLDRETAERLLRGESLEAVDAVARDQAERLAKTLGALSVEHPMGNAELPGEAAALAAFRTARSGRSPERSALGHRARAVSSDAGLVRIGRHATATRGSRWGRSLRLGLSAALAAGMVGGVAVAAGTGVLPVPFGKDHPAPAASVSAAVTPDRPLISPSPNGTSGPGTPRPGGSAAGSAGEGSSREAAGSGTSHSPAAGSGDGRSGSGSWWSGVASSCRDVRDGKSLDAGRKRILVGAAGGTSHVWTYCKGLLKKTGAGSDNQSGSGNDSGSGSGSDGGGQGDDQNGQGDQGDNQGGDEGHIAPLAPAAPGGKGGKGGHEHNGATATPTPSASASASSSASASPHAHKTSASHAPSHSDAPRTAAPSPTYSAL